MKGCLIYRVGPLKHEGMLNVYSWNTESSSWYNEKHLNERSDQAHNRRGKKEDGILLSTMQVIKQSCRSITHNLKTLNKILKIMPDLQLPITLTSAKYQPEHFKLENFRSLISKQKTFKSHKASIELQICLYVNKTRNSNS